MITTNVLGPVHMGPVSETSHQARQNTARFHMGDFIPSSETKSTIKFVPNLGKLINARNLSITNHNWKKIWRLQRNNLFKVL